MHATGTLQIRGKQGLLNATGHAHCDAQEAESSTAKSPLEFVKGSKEDKRQLMLQDQSQVASLGLAKGHDKVGAAKQHTAFHWASSIAHSASASACCV